MNTCSNCGKENNVESKFCINCGQSLTQPPPLTLSSSHNNPASSGSSVPLVKICPQCGWENDPHRRYCISCASFMGNPEASLPSVSSPTSPNLPNLTDDSSYTNDSQYQTLRSIASLCKGIAYLAAIGGGVVGLVSCSATGMFFDDLLSKFIVLATPAFIGFLLYVMFQIISESILVILDIEKNTRDSFLLLKKRLPPANWWESS